MDRREGNEDVVTIDYHPPILQSRFRWVIYGRLLSGIRLLYCSEKRGFKPVKINYIGDWGTQFGKLLTAYRKWGNEEEVRQAPIETLCSCIFVFMKKLRRDRFTE